LSLPPYQVFYQFFFYYWYAKPKLPTAPEFETVDTNFGVVMPPAIGA